MKRIFKYPLRLVDSQTIQIPNVQILGIEVQDEEIVVYAIVNSDDELHDYRFQILGTGHVARFNIKKYTFLGTAKMHEGKLMFHVFYKESGV